MKDDDMNEILRKALSENLAQARHIETLRQQFFYVIIAVYVGAMGWIFSTREPFDVILTRFLAVFLFLLIFSIFTLLNFVKWNNDFKNCITTVQWISERLGLIKVLSKSRKEKIEKSNEQEKEKKKLENSAFFQGFMALPIPLSIRVHKVYELIMYILIASTSWAFFVGLFSSLISLASILGFNLSLSQPSIYFLSLVIAALAVLKCYLTVTRANTMAEKMLDIRQPDGIKIRYCNIPPFWENSKKGKEIEHY